MSTTEDPRERKEFRRRVPFGEVIDRYLRPYRDQHGDVLVPYAHRAPDGFNLGHWLHRIRRDQAKLSSEKVALLNSFGMAWKIRDLEEWIEAAATYQAVHGNLDVPQSYVTPEGIPLGRRINAARMRWRRGNLRAGIRRELEALDPAWHTSPRAGPRVPGTCTEPACPHEHHARDMCRMHYNQWHKRYKRG